MIVVSATDERKAVPYVEALRAVEVPNEDIQVVTPEHAVGGLRELAARASGLVLAGGADIAPERYGAEARPDARLDVNERRDRVEWALLDGAREAGVPVWGVCRGLQVINVYLGGTLWQDIPTQLSSQINHYPKEVAPEAPAHDVRVVAPETALGAALAGEAPVNSRHHQAVKDLAPGLVTAAVSPDGLIEACELPPESGWWVRAVQWHPENLVHLPQQRDLWRAFARAAALAAR